MTYACFIIAQLTDHLFNIVLARFLDCKVIAFPFVNEKDFLRIYCEIILIYFSDQIFL